MRLGWRNLIHDRTRFLVTVLGIAFAVFLMVLQGSLLAGFLRAASVVVDATDAEIWIAGPGVPAFDFPTSLPVRFRAIARGVEGVEAVDRVVAGFSVWQKPDGSRQPVLVVGSDRDVGRRLPHPGLPALHERASTERVIIDRSNFPELGIRAVPVDLEIGRQRAQLTRAVAGFGSFLGTPYVFTAYDDGVRYLGLGPEETTFLLCRVAPGHDVGRVMATLKARLPNTDVWTREAFAARSRSYWLVKTGAGGAILTSGILGFVIGVVIVSQTTYATTMENLEEFATLKAMGARNRYVRRVVLTQALGGGVVGYAIGIAASLPAVRALQGSISWVEAPDWMPALMLVVSLLMCGVASLVAIRKALTVEPGRVFRA